MPALEPALPRQLAERLAAQQVTIRRLQGQLDRFGYDRVDTPLVEGADLFLIKAGDAVISRLVSFDLTGKRLCLRPEFTVPAAWLYIHHFQEQPGAVRLQFAGPVLQYDSLSHTQIHQQSAVGAELLNEHSAAADAEIIALTGKALQDAGVRDWHLIIGHSGLIEGFLDRYELDRRMRRFVLEWLPALGRGQSGLEQACAALESRMTGMPEGTPFMPLDSLPDTEAAVQAMLQAAPQRGPTAGRTREEIVQRLLSKQQQAQQFQRARAALRDLQTLLAHAPDPAQLLSYIHDAPMRAVAQEIIETFELLSAYEIPAERITFDLTFTRNLDYYTGIVFEYRTPQAAGHQLLAGGGRYDELIRLLGAARDVPAVGFTIDVDHVMQAQAVADNAPSSPQTHILIRAQKNEQATSLIAAAAALRDAGFTVTTDLHPQDTSDPLRDSQRYSHILTAESAESFVVRATNSDRLLRVSRHDLNALRRALETT